MKKLLSLKMLPTMLMTVVMVLGIYTSSNAVPLSVFNGWTMLAGEDVVEKDGYIGPGNGGQYFDAEYLFYKVDAGRLFLGLQSGFDLEKGYVDAGKRYYAGDLALSFTGNTSSYKYAVDFGFYTEDQSGNKVGSTGSHEAGLYEVGSWNNDIGYPWYPSNKPYAMESGTKVAEILNEGGSGLNPFSQDAYYYYGGPTSYYRIVSFVNTGFFVDNIAAHWTQSCGNDPITGAVVPEPATMLLLGSMATGLFGFAGLKKRFTK